jgi:hypothetical protein
MTRDDMKDWVKQLCPEIAGWQADLIVEQVDLAVAAEREKCIEVLLSNFDIEDEDVFNVAAAIRERGHVNELAESLTRSDNVLKKDGIRWEVEP